MGLQHDDIDGPARVTGSARAQGPGTAPDTTARPPAPAPRGFTGTGRYLWQASVISVRYGGEALGPMALPGPDVPAPFGHPFPGLAIFGRGRLDPWAPCGLGPSGAQVGPFGLVFRRKPRMARRPTPRAVKVRAAG